MLSADLQEALINIVENVSYSALMRGDKLSPRRFLRIAECSDGGFEASIRGKRGGDVITVFFRVDSTRKGLEIVTRCACSGPPGCEHLIALALLLLRGAVKYEIPWAGSEDPGQVLFEAAVDEFLPVLPPELGQQLEVCLIGAAIEASAEPWWERFIAAAHSETRLFTLSEAARRRLPSHLRSNTIQFSMAPLAELENPFQALREYEKRIQYIADRNFVKPLAGDEGLQAYLESETARENEKGHEAALVRKRLRDWLQTDSAPSADRIEVVWSLVQDDTAPPQLHFSVLLTAKNLNRAPRTASMLHNLCREIGYGTRQLHPDQRRFLDWLDRNRYLLYSMPNVTDGAAKRFPLRQAMTWMNQWLPMGFVAWEDGTPCRYDARPARLVAAPTEERGLAWHVRVEGLDGLELLSGARLFLCKAYDTDTDIFIFVFRGEAFHLLTTDRMPLKLLYHFRCHPEIPLEGIAGTGEAQRLIWQFLDKDTPRSQYFVEVPVRPMLEFFYEEEERLLSMTAHAQAADSSRYYYAAPERWIPALENVQRLRPPESLENLSDEEGLEPIPGVSELPELALGNVVRRSDVAGLEAWLERFIPRAAQGELEPEGGYRWKWKVHRKAHGPLVQLWQARPRGAEYRGNRPFQNLIQPRKAPVFHINVDSAGVNLLKISVAMEQEMEALDYDEVERALKENEDELVLLPRGRLYRRDDLETYRKSLDALLELGIEPGGGEHELHVFQFMHQSVQEALESAESFKRLEELKRRIEEQIRSFKGIPEVRLTASLKSVLRPYQRTGVNFLAWACRTFGGAILADDMGLGKTLQTLAALLVLRKGEKNPGPSLVVCPASVAHNWVREVRHFTPDLKVLLLESGAARKELLTTIPEYDLVVKNYALTRRDIETLRGHQWFMICVDEAQNIKNPSAEITHAVKSLDARYRLALTGTPVENRLLDLWSLADFAVPGTLGTMEAFLERVRVRESALLYRTLRAQLRPMLLRRLKLDVAPELPPRIEERIDCSMHPGQRKLYLAELKKAKQMMAEVTDKKVSGPQRIQILACLTRLRQICCHPALLHDRKSPSGKLDSLMEVVRRVLEEGHKVLVFSQFVKMIEIIEKALQAEEIPYHVLTGKSVKRGAIVHGFETAEAPCVFLISLKAGGTGLNLTAASYVILADPWWNPAVEAQAIDRTHRIGQDKTVIAIRLVTLDTIEERIMELQERKRAMVENVLEEDEFNRSLNRDDFAFILDASEEQH